MANQYCPIRKPFNEQGQVFHPERIKGIIRIITNPKRADIKKHTTLHTLRHSFAIHLMEGGIGIANIQKLLGQSNINTTLIYTPIARDTLLEIKS